METRIGKIDRVSFGLGGYQDACIGLHVTLSGDAWGVGDTNSAWDAAMIECNERSNWTEDDRSSQYAEIVRYISDLLAKAKVKDVGQLEGKPVEATFDGMALKSWRILTEAL